MNDGHSPHCKSLLSDKILLIRLFNKIIVILMRVVTSFPHIQRAIRRQPLSLRCVLFEIRNSAGIRIQNVKRCSIIQLRISVPPLIRPAKTKSISSEITMDSLQEIVGCFLVVSDIIYKV